MSSQNLTAPPSKISCIICQRSEYLTKAGPFCTHCPSFEGTHFFPLDLGPDLFDLLVVGDVPDAPASLPVLNNTTFFKDPGTYHLSFNSGGGKVIRTAVERILSRYDMQGIQPKYTYAVRCAVDNPNKETVDACGNYLIKIIQDVAERRKRANRNTNLVVLACGIRALKALGVQCKKEDDAIGQVFEKIIIGTVAVDVVFTRSLKALGSQDGIFNALLFDVERACKLIQQNYREPLNREKVEKEYIYPKTIEEVKQLVDRVISYTQGNVEPQNWKISFDTETNTLHPNWDGTKLLAVSFAWGVGKSASVALWHKETPYDPSLAYEEIKRLILSNKPLIWFNAKYDFKIFWKLGWPQGDVGNIYWDAFLAEHALEEDKKNFYSLKTLTKQFFPEFAGYEDQLHELLEENEDVEGHLNKLPEDIEEHYNRLLDKGLIEEGFKERELEYYLRKNLFKKFQDSIRIVLGAKKAGEFDKEENKKKEIGGFENIPLKELLFYAAVDADMTRRIAVLQSKRMDEEDVVINQKREQVRHKLQFVPNPNFVVKDYCKTPRPVFNLVRNDYLPRQTELAKIEFNGVTIDQNYLTWGIEALKEIVGQTKVSVWEMAGENFLLGSGQKLAKILFDVGFEHPNIEQAQEYARQYPEEIFINKNRVHYKPVYYTAKGAIQTTDAVMKLLISKFKCPFSDAIQSFKKAEKARNTFFVNIRSLSEYFGDGRLHPGFSLAGTATGRLSSGVKIGDARFNAQNIYKGALGAKKDKDGKLLKNPDGTYLFEGVSCKKLFVPDDDSYCFGNADAKGAEVSVFSAYSLDKNLISALKDGLDAHSFFASEALNPKLVAGNLAGEARTLALKMASIDEEHSWTYEDFLAGKDDKLEDVVYGKRLKIIRDNVKRIVFGMLYGAGIRKISDIIGVSYALGKQIQDLLFSKFPTIKVFMEQVKKELRTFNVVETYHGRRRRFLIGNNAPKDLLARAERRALNFQIQGTNSDIVMSVLCWIAPIIERDFKGRLLLTVHDSIAFQIPKKYAHQIKDVFTEVGTNRVAKACPWLPVPYRWDVELGSSYGDLTTAEKYCAKLPIELPEEMAGYTEEDQYDDIRAEVEDQSFVATKRKK